jgi:hypothetical protein
MKRFLAAIVAPVVLALATLPGPVAAQVITALSSGGASAPAISGVGAVGQILSVPTYSGAAYQWKRNGANISGATSSTYTTVTADGGTTVSVAITLSGKTVVASLQISGTPVTSATLNQAYSGFTLSASGGTPPYSFGLSPSSGALPAGLSINSSSGVVSGTPTAGGTFSNIVARATDAVFGTSDLSPFTLTVNSFTADTSLGTIFQGDAGLEFNSAIGVTDAKTVWYSVFLATNTGQTNETQADALVQALTINSAVCESTAPGICNAFSDGTPNQGRAQLSFTDATGGAGHTVDISNSSTKANCPNGSFLQPGGYGWYLVGLRTDTQNYAVYINGADQGANGTGCFPAPTIPANMLVNLNASTGLHLINPNSAYGNSWAWQGNFVLSTDNVVCSTADAANGFLVTTDGAHHVCVAANTIPADIMAQLASCSAGVCTPNTGGANGALFTGIQPAVYLKGGASSIPNNLGSASSATTFTTRSITTGGALFDAPYGPSGIPAHQATLKYPVQAATNSKGTLALSVAGAPYMSTFAPTGATPAVGDAVIILAGVGDSGGSNDMSMSCDTGWTKVGPGVDGTESYNSVGCIGIVDGSTITTSGAYKVFFGGAGDCSTATNVLTCTTWAGKAPAVNDRVTATGISTSITAVGTANCAAPSGCTLAASPGTLASQRVYTGGQRTKAWTMAIYTNVASIDTGMNSFVVNASSITQKTKSGITVANNNETIVSGLANYNANSSSFPVTISGDNVRFRQVMSGSLPQLMLVDQYAVAAGSFPQQTFNLQATHPDTAAVYTFGLAPN